MARQGWYAPPPPGVLIEVSGDVPHPGVHRVSPPTVERAVHAAGGALEVYPELTLFRGDQVRVEAGRARILPTSDPILVGLPVDLNTADSHALQAIPGIGPTTADAIVADRALRGPFGTLGAVRRVSGVGPSTIEILQPFVEALPVGPPLPPAPLDLNTASATQLERLPGIGPVTASRIVVERAENGPFRSVADLVRVRGIGDKTVDGLAPYAQAVAP